MCMCTPSIRTPLCPKCRPVGSTNIQINDSNVLAPLDKVKEIVMLMDGLSEDGFANRYNNDPAFNKCIRLLADLIRVDYRPFDIADKIPESVDKVLSPNELRAVLGYRKGGSVWV